MRLSKLILGVLVTGLLATACNNNSVDFKKTKAGVPYKVFAGKGGQQIKRGDFVKFELTQKLQNKDTILHSSYKNGMPEYMRVDSSNGTYDIQSTLMELFPTLKEGDSLYLVQAVDTFIAKNPELAKDSLLKKGEKLVSTVKIVKVFTKPEEAQADYESYATRRFLADPKVKQQIAADSKTIEEYLAQKGIKATKTQLGTYVEILQPGSGSTPVSGQFAMLRYKGTNLQGAEFDSNTDPSKPLLPLQIGTGGSIKGFEDGVMQLRKGGKARLYIPSMLGYGPQGAPPRIQPNQILVFEISLEDITTTPPPMPGMEGQPQQPGEVDTTNHTGHNH
jgi:FKBP-type peptidyl-prolyl cis-trans isomerase FkpA